MKRLSILLLAILVAVGASTTLVLARSPEGADVWNSAEIDWKDMRNGVKEATRTGKPVLMLFQATWCSACKRYRNVFRDKEIVAASRNLVMILVDVDKDPKLNGAFAYDGAYVPRTIFLDSTGERRADLRGRDPQYPHSLDVTGPGELLALMRRAGEGTTSQDPGRRASTGE
jgi:thiol:disulfide interchange protein